MPLPPAYGNHPLQVDHQWLFAFCVAALNDRRVDEVSQRDYEMRLAVSEKYSPLIHELLGGDNRQQQQPAAASSSSSASSC